MTRSAMLKKLDEMIHGAVAAWVVNQMDEAGMPWEPEEPWWPRRIKVVQERVLAESMRLTLGVDDYGPQEPLSREATAREIFEKAADAYNREREAEVDQEHAEAPI